MSEFLVGLGLDFHRLAPGEELILGGLQIESEKGTVAHSDGDVLIHAVCDALLGAADLGDIGVHFPDDDPNYEGVSSVKLLLEVIETLREKDLRPVNVDATIILQRPKVNHLRARMEANLEEKLSCPVNVKATTTERMGSIGRGEGIGAQAIVSLKNREKESSK